jgi:hypothetical protein
MYSLHRNNYDEDPFALRAQGVNVSEHYVKRYNEKNKPKPVDPEEENEWRKLPGESDHAAYLTMWQSHSPVSRSLSTSLKAVIDNLIVVSKLQTGMGGKFYIDVMQSFIDECKKGFKYDMDCELKLNQLKRLIEKLKSLKSVNEIFEYAFSGTVLSVS